jgi:hypothetical protein
MFMKKISQQIIIAGFILFIFFTGLFVLSFPKIKFSNIENRMLATFPAVNFSTIENKKAMDGIEKYVADHFSLRTEWVKAKSYIEVFMGKRKIAGVYITDERMIQQVTLNTDIAEKNINAVNAFASHYDVPTYIALIPTSAGIYPETLPANVPNLDQNAFINDVYNKLDEKITTIKVFDILYEHRDEYIYHRTDHHWAVRGAFTAYGLLGEKMGYTPLGLDSFDIEHAAFDFRGSSYSNTLYDGYKPDIIDIYHSKTDTKITEVKRYMDLNSPPIISDELFFRENLNTTRKYTVYLSSGEPRMTINSTADGGKLLVFKDSFSNPLVPFLTEHYSEITMLDMRYINIPLDDFINVSDYDQVLFFYNVFSMNTDPNLIKFVFE